MDINVKNFSSKTWNELIIFFYLFKKKDNLVLCIELNGNINLVKIKKQKNIIIIT
jgi:hypothetical protein